MTFGESMAIDVKAPPADGLVLTPTEIALVVLFRRHVRRYSMMPTHWRFEIHCNPERLAGTFADQEQVKVDTSLSLKKE